jgi:alkaline phosphatase
MHKCFLLALLLSVVIPVQAQVRVAKNIIIMIADGWGYNQIEATNDWNGTSQSYQTFPVQYAMSNYSWSTLQNDSTGYSPDSMWTDWSYQFRRPTDSAAAATALSTGQKVPNGWLNLYPENQNPITPAGILAKQNGFAVGIVTSVQFCHATPAAFWTNNISRGNYSEIAQSMILNDSLDLLIGTGHPEYNNDGILRISGFQYTYVVDEVFWSRIRDGIINQSRPWTLVETLQDFIDIQQAVTPDRILGIPMVGTSLQYGRSGNPPANYPNPPYENPLISSVPSLSQLTSAAVNNLSLYPDGFFLMIEAGSVDWANHTNRLGRMIEAMDDFNASVDSVIAWVDRSSGWDETLLIVTGDHETGCLYGLGADTSAAPYTALQDSGAGNMPGFHYFHSSHTNQLIPLFSKGIGSELFHGLVDGIDPHRGEYIDNTDVGEVLSQMIDSTLTNASPVPFSLISPADNDTCWTLETTLLWHSTYDPDPLEIPLFDLWLDTLADLSTKWLLSDSIADTTFVLSNLMDDHIYHWTARATDINTSGTWANDTLSFITYLPEVPEDFILLTPVTGTLIFENLVTLNWSSSNDNDPGDELIYEIQRSTDPTFATYESSITSETTLTLTELIDEATIFWRIKATDNYGLFSWASPGEDGWFFDVNIPESPLSFSLISPSDNSVIATNTVTLSWHEAVDPDTDDSIVYHLFISETDDFSLLVDELLVTETQYEKRDLGDNKSYWWKVRAQDTNTSGTWSNETWMFSVDIPENPSAFTLHTPTDGTTINSDEVTLSWYPTTDVDPEDVINYTVEWSVDLTFATFESFSTSDTFYVFTDMIVTIESFGGDDGTNKAVTTTKSIRDGKSSSANINRLRGGSVTWSQIDSLPDDTMIYWRVKAVDQDDNETYALPGESGWSLSVYLVEAPTAFSLTLPLDESVLEVNDMSLTWNASSDFDPGDVLSYIVYLATDEAFTQGADSVVVTATTYDLPVLLDDTEYWWKVRAQDTNTSGTWSNETWTFSVAIPEAPEEFALIGPNDETVIEADSVVFNWFASSDNDPEDVISYHLEWSSDPTFATFENLIVDDVTATVYNIADDGEYFWRVKAVDTYDLFTYALPGENGWSFTIEVPDPPLTFNIVSPADSLELDTLSYTFVWDETTDPDPEDTINYQLAISMSEIFDDSLTAHYNPGADTSFIVPYMSDDTDFWWRVLAEDTNTDGTYSDSVNFFHTAMPEAPHEFEMIECWMLFTESEDSVDVSVTWGRAYDPDPDSEELYAIYVDLDETMENQVLLMDNITVPASTDTFYVWTARVAVADLPSGDGADFYITVHALDHNSEGTWATNVVNTHLSNIFDDPWSGLPIKYEIASLYPNPFNPTLTVVIALPFSSDLRVVVYNIMGRVVAELTNIQHQAGYHSFVFDGTGLSSGVYFVHAVVPEKLNQVQKIVLMK